MDPAEILPTDENAAVVPAAKKVSEPLGDITVTVRSPLLDVSNRSFADFTLNGSSNEGDKTIVEVDDSITCGGKSETESPASSTTSRLDTTTDDYESADEGPSSPIRDVNLSVLASQLESLSLGTPSPALGRPGALFPYSPVTENSILLSSPEKDDGLLDKTIGVSPITMVGSPHVTVLSSVSDENVSSGNNLLEPVFKIPGAVVKHERPSIVSSTTTGRSDDSFYTADSTFWSPYHDHNATIIELSEDKLDQNIVESAVEESHPSNASASAECESQHASPEIECKSKKHVEEMLNNSPRPDEILETVEVNSPVNDFIAKSDKITLRKDSPLASSIQEKHYGEDLNLSLAPAQVDIDQVICHSTEFCKKDILFTPKYEVVRRHSFQEKLPDELVSVTESPERRRSSTDYFLNIKKSVSSNSLNKSSDRSAELEFHEEVVDSCIAAASITVNQDLSALSSTVNYVAVLNAEETTKENLATAGIVVDEVCEESFIVENAIGERFLEETEVTHFGLESPVQVDNSHEAHLYGKDLSIENKDPTSGREILPEANPMPSPSTAGLSISRVFDGLSIDDSKDEGSLNSEESVATNESTVIENHNVVISTEPNQELVAHTAPSAREDAIACIPSGADILSENTEAAVLSEQQSSTAASVQSMSENFVSPLAVEECGLHIVDKVVLGLTNNTSGEEKLIEAAELLNQTSKIVESAVSFAHSAKEDARASIPSGADISSEIIEATVMSEQQSSTAASVQSMTENFVSPLAFEECGLHIVDKVVLGLTNNTSGEEKLIEAAELLNQTSKIVESAVSFAHSAKEDARASIPNGADISSEITEATVMSEQQSSTAASIHSKSENLAFPLPVEECGLHIVDKVVLGLNNNTSGEEKLIEAAELLNQTSKMVESAVSFAHNAKEDARASIPSGADIPSEITEATVISEQQISTAASIHSMSENLVFPLPVEECGLHIVDKVVLGLTNNTSGEEKLIEAAELLNQTSKIVESAVSFAHNAKEDARASIPSGADIPSEITEVTVISEQQSSTAASIHSKSENLVFPLPVEECGLHIVDKVVLALTNNTSGEEKLIEAAELLNQTSKIVESAVSFAHNAQEDARASIPNGADIPSEITEATVMSEQQSSAAASIHSKSENLVEECGLHIVDEVVLGLTNNTSGEEKLIEAAELPNQTCKIAESAVSLPLKAIAIEDKMSEDELNLVFAKPDLNINVVTSSDHSHKLMIKRSAENADDASERIPNGKGMSFEKTEVAYLSELQSRNTEFIQAEQPSESLPFPVVNEVYTNNTSVDEKIIEAAELPNLAGKRAESDVPLTLKAVTIEDKLTSSLDEMHIVRKPEHSTEFTSQLPGTPSKPDSNVNVVTSSEPNHELVVAQTADITKEDSRNITKIPTEVTYLSELQSSTTPSIQAEQSTEYLPSSVESEVRTNNTSGEEQIISAVEHLIQGSVISESAVSLPSKAVAVENKLGSSPKEMRIVQTPEDITEHTTFRLPGIPYKPDSKVNVASTVKVDVGSGMSTLGESFIVIKNDRGVHRAETNPNENELIKKVDFSSLSGSVQEKPRVEQDIKSESMNFYSSPESTEDQNTFGGKSDAMDRSHKDLSEIFATCSKQEQELGGRTFDFSCIQAEAAKIASDITHANETKQTNTQLMMQSAFSAETNNSEAGPVTADEDLNKEEFFHEVTELDFDYLARAGSKLNCPSKLSRQSLYVKFDPLVGKIVSSEDCDSSLITAMADHNRSSGEDGKLDVTPPSHSESDERLIPITPSTAKKENRQNAGGHTPSLRQEISKLQELMIQQEQAHQEKADLVEELRSRIAELEASDNHRDSGDLEKKLKLKDEELKLTQEELDRAKGSNKQLVQVMEEYEKTISQLVTVKEETKAQMEKDKETIAAERDTALQHLSNMEVAFNDIHQKYERAKTVIETLHANEKELKKSYDAVVETVEAQNVAYQKLKQHAAEKLTGANAEIEKIHKEYNGEMARMKAVAKKNELKCKSLEESLEQKKKELRELTQICDELIGKVTGKPYE